MQVIRYQPALTLSIGIESHVSVNNLLVSVLFDRTLSTGTCSTQTVHCFLLHAAQYCSQWGTRPSSLWERSLCQVRRHKETVDLSASFTGRGRIWSVFYFMFPSLYHLSSIKPG